MKKLLILSSALCTLASYSANAEINVDIAFPGAAAPVYENPGYVMAPDYPSQHYDHHRHRHNDYWAIRQQQERDHQRHDVHDNGKHAEAAHRDYDNHGHK